MGWAAIIAALVQAFGPILADWLKKCGEQRAHDAAETLPSPETFGSGPAAVDALLAKIKERMPRRWFMRRALLQRMKAVASQHDITGPGFAGFGEEDVKELAGLAEAAAEE